MSELTTDTNEIITGYKAFDPDFKCRDYQYEVGKTFEHNGKIQMCYKGFHFCYNDPIDVFQYYPLVYERNGQSARLAKVSALKKDTIIDRDGFKCVTSKISIDEEITLDALINEQVKKAYNRKARGASIVATDDELALTDKKPLTKIVSNKNHTRIALTHSYSIALASADDAYLVSSGRHTGLFAIGREASVSSSGYSSMIYNSGDLSSTSSSGVKAKLRINGNDASVSSSGFGSYLNVTGIDANISSSGDISTLKITGNRAGVASSGDFSKLTVIGKKARMAVVGNGARVTYEGKGGVISVLGIDAKFKGSKGTLVLAATYNCRGEPTGGLVGRIGEDGLKPDTLYTVSDGEFVEVEA